LGTVVNLPSNTPSSRYRFWRRVVVYCVLALMLLFTFLLATIRRSELYEAAFMRAMQDPMVGHFLGFPVSGSLMVRGGLQALGMGASAEFSIPLSGPKDDAVIYAYAVWHKGRWKFQTLEVTFERARRTVDLLRYE
jgi:hypothetical protein